MADFTIKDPPEYNPLLRKLEPTDPNYADVFNRLFEQLINNDVFLAALAQKTAEALLEHCDNGVIHVTAQDKQEWDAKAKTAEGAEAVPRYISGKLVMNEAGWYRVAKVNLYTVSGFVLKVAREWSYASPEGFSIGINVVQKAVANGADIYEVNFSQINAMWRDKIIDKVRLVCDNRNNGMSYIDLHYNRTVTNSVYVRIDGLFSTVNDSIFDVEMASPPAMLNPEIEEQTVHEYEITRRGNIAEKAIADVDGNGIPETYTKKILKAYTAGKDMDEYREEGWWYIPRSDMCLVELHHPVQNVGGVFRVKITPNKTGTSEPWGILQSYYVYSGLQTQNVRVLHRHYYIDSGWSDWGENILVEDVSNPNLIINPDFSINQRGITVLDDPFRTDKNNTYGADHWLVQSNGSETHVRYTFSENGSVKAELLSNGGGSVCIRQYFEDCITQSFYDKDLTISFHISDMVRHYDGGGISPTIVFLWGKDATTGTYRQAGADVVFTEPGTYQYTWHIDGSKKWVNLMVNFYLADARYGSIAGDYTVLDWVKLELGNVATRFVLPDPATELLKCQRYYREFSGVY
ncbi:MAG: pyocin knob domain-containing protein, partial [Lachnospiraceae bacterium]|nr:pyocin knob domain-containing protein [Lachnospiraceae bacterium]